MQPRLGATGKIYIRAKLTDRFRQSGQKLTLYFSVKESNVLKENPIHQSRANPF